MHLMNKTSVTKIELDTAVIVILQLRSGNTTFIRKAKLYFY